MNNKDLFKAIGNIEDAIIDESDSTIKQYKHIGIKKVVIIAAAICILICSSITALAFSFVKKNENELYIRYLSSANINMQQDDSFDSELFFTALKSNDVYVQYIAINRLVECFNDDNLRLRAINELNPFLSSGDEKLVVAARFSIDILSKTFDDSNIYTLSDGTIIFTLFNDYSDYGSYNVIWQIKSGILSPFFSFSNPSMYITKILLSPDKSKLAVSTCSNKSQFLVVFEPANSMVSPELIGSAVNEYGAIKKYDVFRRIDNETYSGFNNLLWKNNNTIIFDAYLSYSNTDLVENVSVVYNYKEKTFDIAENNLIK